MLKMLAILVLLLGVQYAMAKPNNRMKRVSDSYLSKLETQATLDSLEYRKRSEMRPNYFNDARIQTIAKRISSPHLADLETKIALNNKIKGFAITLPVGAGRVDPYRIAKRISSPHLADLETKIALNNKIKGFAITLPVGAGRVDPYRIGRKRRSDPSLLEALFSRPDDEDPSEPSPPLEYGNTELDYIYQIE